MKTNLHLNDKMIRMFIAAVLAIVCLQVGGVAGIVAGVSALALMATVAFSWCPVYHLIGFSTCKVKEA